MKYQYSILIQWSDDRELWLDKDKAKAFTTIKQIVNN